MTSNCERESTHLRTGSHPARTAARLITAQALILSLLVGLSLACIGEVRAENGAQLPPPPRLKQRSINADPDFQSPLRSGGNEGFGGGGGGGQFRRRKRLLEEPGEGGGQRGQFQRRKRLLEQMEAGGGNGTGFGGGAGVGFARGPGRFRNLEAALGGGLAGGGGAQGAGLTPGAGGGFGAGGGQRRGGGGMNMGMGGMLGGREALDLTPLNLSEEQKQRIRQIRSSSRERAKEVRQSLVQKQMELRSLLFSPDANEQQIRAARRQLRSIQDQMDDLNLEDLLQIRGVLTAEQRQKLPDIAPPMRGMGGRTNALVRQ